MSIHADETFNILLCNSNSYHADFAIRPSDRQCSGRRCPSRHQWGVGRSQNDAQPDGAGYIIATASDRDRVKHLQKCLLAQTDNNSKRYVLACAYAKYEESIRHGRTELQSGRFVAEHFFTDERDNRINGRRNGPQWYRRRARTLIVGYRHFIATGTLMPETRGKCGGKSIIHDTGVQNLCR